MDNKTVTGYFPVGSVPEAPMQRPFVKLIRAIHDALTRWGLGGWFTDGMAIMTVEPRRGYEMKGMIADDLTTHAPNVNPEELTEAQRTNPPVFVFPGDHSGQGSFLYLLNQLAIRHPDVAFFAMNLPSPDGTVSAAHHLQTIIAKIRQVIQTHFAGHPPPYIGLMGHSSGSTVQSAVVDALEDREHQGDLPRVGFMIRLGEFFKSEEEAYRYHTLVQGFVCEIGGVEDVLEGCTSYLPRQYMVPGKGHLGILSDPTVLDYVDQRLGEWLDFLSRRS